MSFYDAI